MTRKYEAVYVLDASLEDEAISDKLQRYAGLLGSPADLELNHWGRRQLAYPIGRREQGYYVVARFTADPVVLPEFERALKLDDAVIRYLVTLYDRELGAPPMTEEELAAANARRGDDDEEDDE
jgi:small subunit ribosomal protein S6